MPMHLNRKLLWPINTDARRQEQQLQRCVSRFRFLFFSVGFVSSLCSLCGRCVFQWKMNNTTRGDLRRHRSPLGSLARRLATLCGVHLSADLRASIFHLPSSLLSYCLYIFIYWYINICTVSKFLMKRAEKLPSFQSSRWRDFVRSCARNIWRTAIFGGASKKSINKNAEQQAAGRWSAARGAQVTALAARAIVMAAVTQSAHLATPPFNRPILPQPYIASRSNFNWIMNVVIAWEALRHWTG